MYRVDHWCMRRQLESLQRTVLSMLRAVIYFVSYKSEFVIMRGEMLVMLADFSCGRDISDNVRQMRALHCRFIFVDVFEQSNIRSPGPVIYIRTTCAE